jgi:4-hydroxybenzoate polyprenyltransferase
MGCAWGRSTDEPAAAPSGSEMTPASATRPAIAVSIGRLHIVAIAALGTLTFGWLFTGRYPWLAVAVSALDWFLVNLLNRVVDRAEDQVNQIPGAGLVVRHRRAILFAGLLLLGVSLVVVHLIRPGLTPLRLAGHLLAAAYNWPLLPGPRRLKRLYFWKNTASTIGFLITVFGYPLAAAWRAGGLVLAPDITTKTIVAAGVFFFLFELSYEVIYDLRDVPGDRAAGVRTYPVVHGAAVASRIVDGLLAAATLVLIAAYLLRWVPWRLAIMAAAPMIQFGYHRWAVRRGISQTDCIRLTWIGVALLVGYHLWILADLPGARA